jgi:hypothetical protein
MIQRIIYATPEGGVAIIIPTGELPAEVVARKDVPQGVPYKIVDLADIESEISDRTFRAAWEAEDFTPDGFGDPEGYWAEKEAERLEQEANFQRPSRDNAEVTEVTE